MSPPRFKRPFKRATAALLAAAGLVALVAGCATPPRTVTYRFTFQVNVHDDPSGYAHLYDTVGVTVDPTGYVTNMTSSLASSSYGVEGETTSLHPRNNAEGSTYTGPTTNINGWTTYLHTDADWDIRFDGGIFHFTMGSCHTRFNFAVESGGGVRESVAYALWTWSGSCTNGQTLSTAS